MRYYEGKNNENGFEMDYELGKKVLHIIVEGSFNENIGLKFLAYYNNILKKINSQKTNLIIESQNLNISLPNMIEIMKQCYQLYNSSNFTKMIVVLPTSVTVALQAKNKAKDAGFTGEFAKSLDEAYSLVNT
jgi:hypothetical protein